MVLLIKLSYLSYTLSIDKSREKPKRLQGTHRSSLNGCIMRAQPSYANYHLKPIKFIIFLACLLVVKVIYFLHESVLVSLQPLVW